MSEWSVKKALFILIGSTACTFSLCLMGYWFYQKRRQEKLTSEKYKISVIAQTGPEKEALPTAYLAEILELSIDQPTTLYALNLKAAKKKLLTSPLIASARVKRIAPSTLYVDYELRKPIAQIADYKNTAVDKEGYLFPIAPFLSPKQLPEIYLGAPSEGWQIKGPQFQLALEILHFLEEAPWKEGLRVKRLDVSNAFSPSLGTREIVLFTEEDLLVHKKNAHPLVFTFPKILRLTPKDYVQQLGNFFSLRKTMMEDYNRQISSFSEKELPAQGRYAPRIIDLRIPQLAFVEKG